MPKWIDANHIEGEMTDAQFDDAVEELMRNRVERENREGKPGKYSADGLIIVYEEHYPGPPPYTIAVYRYFSVNRRDGQFPRREQPGDWNHLNKHVTLEGDTRIPYEVRDFLDLHSLLWQDTSISYRSQESLREMWEAMEQAALADLATISALPTLFEQKVQEYRELLPAGSDLSIEAQKKGAHCPNCGKPLEHLDIVDYEVMGTGTARLDSAGTLVTTHESECGDNTRYSCPWCHHPLLYGDPRENDDEALEKLLKGAP